MRGRVGELGRSVLWWIFWYLDTYLANLMLDLSIPLNMMVEMNDTHIRVRGDMR